MKTTGLLISILCFFLQVNAQQNTSSPILFIYDASGSMWGQMDGKTKKEIASDVLSQTVNKLNEGQQIGLVAYGHRKKGDCDDVEFMVALENQSREKITASVNNINPLGRTPLARSATMAINSLRESGTRATIILITDGIESCDGDICAVVTKAREEGIDFKLHIVGFGLKEGETTQLECAAKAGAGQYYNARDAEGLSSVLTEATSETVDEPAGNFSLFALKNGEAVDAWVKAVNTVTREEVDQTRTYRDTGWIHLPPGIYEIAINPLEGTDIPGTSIIVEMAEAETKHENISFDGGELRIKTTNNGEGWDAVVKIYDQSTGKEAASCRTYGKEQYVEIPAGKYKLTFQALRIKGLENYTEIENIGVTSNKKTPVSHDFKSGTAFIGVQTKDGALVDATVNFHEIEGGKNVAGGRTYTSVSSNPKEFLLSPGTYDVKIISLGKHKGHKETVRVTVETGKRVEKIITF